MFTKYLALILAEQEDLQRIIATINLPGDVADEHPGLRAD